MHSAKSGRSSVVKSFLTAIPRTCKHGFRVHGSCCFNLPVKSKYNNGATFFPEISHETWKKCSTLESCASGLSLFKMFEKTLNMIHVGIVSIRHKTIVNIKKKSDLISLTV